MFCDFCGCKLEEGMVFCPECGTKVKRVNEAVSEEERTEIIGEERNDGSVQDEEAATIIYHPASSGHEEIQPETEAGPAVAETAVEMPEADVQVTVPDSAPVTAESASAAQEPVIYCPMCGMKNHGEDLFCVSCGARLDGSGLDGHNAPEAGTKKQKKVKVKKEKTAGKSNFKLIGVCAAAVVIVVAVIAAAAAFLIVKPAGKGSSDFYYLKDNELWQGSVKNDSLKFIDDDILEDDEDASWGVNLQKTEDGKYLLYSKNVESVTDYYYDLYCVEMNKKNAEPVKIASEVQTFLVLKSNRVLYQNADGALYLSDLKADREKIAKDVDSFRLSEDEKNLLWLSDVDGKLYVMNLAKSTEDEKIDSDVTSLVACSDDLKTVVYKKDSAVYVLRDLQDKEKISEDVLDVKVSDINGKYKVFYTRETNSAAELSLYDFIEDDLAASDSAIQEPKIEDYQHTEERETFWGIREEVVTDDAYYEQQEKYYEKLERDEMREYFKSQTFGSGDFMWNAAIMMYDGSTKESTTVLEDTWLISDYSYNSGNSTAECVGLLAYFNEEDIAGMLQFSKLIEDVDSELGNFQQDLMDVLTTAIQVDNQIIEIDLDGRDYEDIQIDKDADRIYMLLYEIDEEGNEEEDTRVVARIAYSGENAGKIEIMDTEVDSIAGLNDSKLYYIKDTDSKGNGDLYCNGNRLDSDARPWIWGQEDGNILYKTDYDTDDYSYTLKVYDGKNTQKIASDVYTYLYYDESCILFLSDYNREKCRGELKLYNGKESKLIESDVMRIFMVN